MQKKKVAFQGETGAFSEQAVLGYFAGTGIQRVPMPSFEEVFDSVKSGAVGAAVLPIENSLFGSVHANYDLLREHDLHITGEIKVRIVHNLLGLSGSSKDSISRVYSHPQAIGQCRRFLRDEMPHAEIVAAYDTAGAAKMVAEMGEPSRAAIASAAAARVYGLEILASSIESDHRNYTRFIVLERGPAEPVAGGGAHKTSIVFAMKENVPGVLFKSLAVFALRDLDLLKIESRPLVGQPWAYLFYLDFSGSTADEPVQRALGHLSELTDYLKVLGSYPAGRVID